jgi:Zn-dependent M28 family amino/carboxypeptidase
MVGLLLVTAVLSVARPYLDGGASRQGPSAGPPKANVPQIPVPAFQADSAYLFVQKQVAFGPRVPNSAAHKKCAAWFVQEFKRHGMTVIEQPFKAPHFKGGQWEGINIIAQYRPEISKRILLAAHWDSRFQADKDTKDREKPIDGADDGASGVAVLLEIARTLAANPVDIGVDLILFDVEDQGDDQGNSAETWCLGSQHWAANLHVPGYMPYYAVLLDMVGAKDARFYKEGFSREVAPRFVDKVWKLAQSLGYGEYFVNESRGPITDDHVFVIRKARIPMIDIINMPNQGESPFGAYHHTHDDNLSIIDPNVLKAVGQTMTALIYQTHNQVF